MVVPTEPQHYSLGNRRPGIFNSWSIQEIFPTGIVLSAGSLDLVSHGPRL
jgi:hypothetical protein